MCFPPVDYMKHLRKHNLKLFNSDLDVFKLTILEQIDFLFCQFEANGLSIWVHTKTLVLSVTKTNTPAVGHHLLPLVLHSSP